MPPLGGRRTIIALRMEITIESQSFKSRNDFVFLHTKPSIPGGEKPIFPVVIH